MTRTLPGFLALLVLLLPAPARAGDTEPAGADVATVRARHLLRRATFGPRAADLEAVKRLGREAWVERQLHPELIPDRQVEDRLSAYESLGLTTTGYWAMLEDRRPALRPPDPGEDRTAAARKRQQEVNRLRNLALREVPASVLLRAVYSERQLEEVMVEFWRNHFNVDVNKDQVRYYLPDWEREVLRKHVFGDFESFLLATARHPAMLFYLDNHVSQAPMARGEKVLRGNEREGRTDGLNENYARELMELHTLGVDNGYDQDDVIQFALVLTGWSIENVGENRGASSSATGITPRAGRRSSARRSRAVASRRARPSCAISRATRTRVSSSARSWCATWRPTTRLPRSYGTPSPPGRRRRATCARSSGRSCSATTSTRRPAS